MLAGENVAVIIPYFQTQPGVLRAAIQSAQMQRDVSVAIVVVDDGSPWPASREVAGLEGITVVDRSNGGPGAARNTGLDNLPRGVRYAAFLDSDDTWSPDHLSRAVCALARGYDLYVSNWYPLEGPVGLDRYARGNRFDPQRHEALGDDLYAFQGDFIAQELTGPLVRLSTVCLDLDTLGHLRFDESLRYASEDLLYAIEVALAGARVVVSTRPEVQSGRGDNIFSGAVYGTPSALRMGLSQVAGLKRIAKRISEPKHSALVDARVVSVRNNFARNAIHCTRTGFGNALLSLSRFALADPKVMLALAPAIQGILTGRAKSKRSVARSRRESEPMSG